MEDDVNKIFSWLTTKEAITFTSVAVYCNANNLSRMPNNW